ncbi:MAG: DUF4956 domain-containing protein [Candidatus Marinimicrobia bacterium]|nr:DUF4956 domain-containing protein [Candidatus Neomarinimicrobiota bacterium]
MQSIQQFIDTGLVEISLVSFITNLILAVFLSSLLAVFYVRYGDSLSNRRAFAKNFLLLAVTTTLIITIIKSSLALSLGLIGALSIVRFRAAIKDPEELVYLFLAIAVGLGLGAEQRIITITALVLILIALWLRNLWTYKKKEPNLYLNISLLRNGKSDLQKIISVLKNYCLEVGLKRFDETAKNLEASFLVKYDNFEELNRSKTELRRLFPDVEVSFVDNKTL